MPSPPIRFGQWLRDATEYATQAGQPVPAEDRCRAAYEAGMTPQEFARMAGCNA